MHKRTQRNLKCIVLSDRNQSEKTVQLYDTNYIYFPASSNGKESAYNAGDLGLIPGSERSPGEGNGNALQCSCLENPIDRGAWWATVPGVSKSRHDWVHTCVRSKNRFSLGCKDLKIPVGWGSEGGLLTQASQRSHPWGRGVQEPPAPLLLWSSPHLATHTCQPLPTVATSAFQSLLSPCNQAAPKLHPERQL